MSPCRFASVVLQPSFLALGGDEEIRNLDPLLAGQVLSQLSYTPIGVRALDPENRTTNYVSRTLSLISCELISVFVPNLNFSFAFANLTFLSDPRP